jgi:hypothetical protein
VKLLKGDSVEKLQLPLLPIVGKKFSNVCILRKMEDVGVEK